MAETFKWNGKKVDELTREEAIEAVKYLIQEDMQRLRDQMRKVGEGLDAASSSLRAQTVTLERTLSPWEWVVPLIVGLLAGFVIGLLVALRTIHG